MQNSANSISADIFTAWVTRSGDEWATCLCRAALLEAVDRCLSPRYTISIVWWCHEPREAAEKFCLWSAERRGANVDEGEVVGGGFGARLVHNIRARLHKIQSFHKWWSSPWRKLARWASGSRSAVLDSLNLRDANPSRQLELHPMRRFGTKKSLRHATKRRRVKRYQWR